MKRIAINVLLIILVLQFANLKSFAKDNNIDKKKPRFTNSFSSDATELNIYTGMFERE